MYNPVEYWQKRETPAPNPIPEYAKEYIARHIENCETILDYGVGDGRMLPLYKDRIVTGYDIVPRELTIPVIYELNGYYDCVICSKVLLHVLPKNIKSIMKGLSRRSKKVIVYDASAKCTAPHNFNHPFNELVEMNDVMITEEDLLFWYE